MSCIANNLIAENRPTGGTKVKLDFVASGWTNCPFRYMRIIVDYSYLASIATGLDAIDSPRRFLGAKDEPIWDELLV